MTKISSKQEALDYAIRDSEISSESDFGYKIDGKDPYENYMSNKTWDIFLKQMPEEHYKQFEDGNGGELKEKKGRYGINPPKMASYGSSSRLIYELSKDIDGFIFEERLDTRVGGTANLDGLLRKGNEYIYVEAKRREIYCSSHEKQAIKSVYKPVYEYLKNSQFSYDIEDIKGTDKQEETMTVTFKIDNEPVIYFDLKQLICHFLGITNDLSKHSVKNAKVTFLYLLYNPNVVKEKIDEKYREKVIDRYEEVKSFIINNNDIFKAIFYAVLQYQTEIHKFEKTHIDFDFKLVDQNTYIDELKR